MNERSWERLLKSIEGGLVVPVLGPQILINESGQDSLQAQIARQLAERVLREGYRHGLLASDLINAALACNDIVARQYQFFSLPEIQIISSSSLTGSF